MLKIISTHNFPIHPHYAPTNMLPPNLKSSFCIGVKSRTSHMLTKHSSTELAPFLIFILT